MVKKTCSITFWIGWSIWWAKKLGLVHFATIGIGIISKSPYIYIANKILQKNFATIGIGIMQDPLFPCTSLAQQKQKPAEKAGSVRKSWEGRKGSQREKGSEGKKGACERPAFQCGIDCWLGGQPSNLGGGGRKLPLSSFHQSRQMPPAQRQMTAVGTLFKHIMFS